MACWFTRLMGLALAPSFVKSRRRPRLRRIALDPGEAADAASLRYVLDTRPGIQRMRHGRAFRYVKGDGEAVRDLVTLRRIRSLAIPPAWTQVWICPVAHGHIQAVGRDARGRKQYRYHPRWREARDETNSDWIGTDSKNDRDCLSRPLSSQGSRCTGHNDDCYLTANQIRSQCR